jgi:O-antigen ligase
MFTLAAYVPSQLAISGTLTARLREVNLVLMLCFFALLSMPFAISRADSWTLFKDLYLKVVLIFVVMVNAVRTERRLKGLLFLALAVGCVLSVTGVNDYYTGTFTLAGSRIYGRIGGLFGNPNDLALHLATMTPIAIGLLLGTRSHLLKGIYAVCVGLFVAGIIVTFSRAGFLGLAASTLVLMWKLGRRHRFATILFVVISLAAVFALAPENYSHRLLTIGSPSADQTGSANQRLAVLFRAVSVSLRNPVFGVGLGNLRIVSLKDQVAHNAYIEVWAEMGIIAMVVYILLVISPFRRLRQVECTASRRNARFYYLAVGLQASLAAYMVSSFFASVCYQWYIYYLVAYAVGLHRIYMASHAPASQSTTAVQHRGRALRYGEVGRTWSSAQPPRSCSG